MGKNKYTTISIPEPLADRLKKDFVDDTGFTSLSDLATFIFREMVNEGKEHNLEEARERVKQRLKALGYID